MKKLQRDRYIAWVGYTSNDIQVWGQYERLVDFILTEYPKTGERFDMISYPTLFLLSHAIELALKENIKFFKQYHESPHLTKFENWAQLIKSHDLDALCVEYKIAYTRLHAKVKASKEDRTEFIKYFESLSKLIDILSRSSETYRYTIKLDKDGNPIKESIPVMKQIDFVEIIELFKTVKILFIGAPNSMAKYTDYLDFMAGNPEFKGGKGYLYCQKLPFDESFLAQVKEQLNVQLSKIGDNKWYDKKTGETFEVKIWENSIYIIAV